MVLLSDITGSLYNGNAQSEMHSQQAEELKEKEALILRSGCLNGLHLGRGLVRSSPSEVELLLPRKADNGPSPICTAFHVTVAPEIHVIVWSSQLRN